MAAEMSDAVLDLAAAGIRRRHPEYDASQVAEALVDLLRSRTAPPTMPSSSKRRSPS